MDDKVIIGTSDDYGKIGLSVPTLIETRILVTSSSGGGKSWFTRRFLEQSHGKVQHIIFDVVGEFKTLREKFDYLIVGRDADCKAQYQTAELLARKLLELKVSTICDLSAEKRQHRFIFVEKVIHSLLSAPAKHRQPVIIVIDEAHKFCPQNDKVESRQAVIDLMAEGRKYGLCGWLATQRISKLAKDACAEAQNRCVGVTTMDLDRARAGDELGMSKQGRLILRTLKPGQFYCYGPAIDRPPDVDAPIVKIGNVKTTHPKVGNLYKLADVVPPTKAMLSVLSKLTDLPEQASREAKTMAELKQECTNLRRELTLERKNKAATSCDHGPELARLRKQLAQIGKHNKEMQLRLAPIRRYMNNVGTEMARIGNCLDSVAGQASDDSVTIQPAANSPEVATRPFAPAIPNIPTMPANGDDTIAPRFQAVLDALALFASVGIAEPNRRAVAALVKNTPGTGAFNTKLSDMKKQGLIDYPSTSCVSLTDIGHEAARPPDVPLTLAEFHRAWFRLLPPRLEKLLTAIMARYPDSLDRQELAIEVGMTFGTGAFNTYLSELKKTYTVIEYPDKSTVRASDVLYPKVLQQ
jgi:ribosomal protein L29